MKVIQLGCEWHPTSESRSTTWMNVLSSRSNRFHLLSKPALPAEREVS